MKIDKIQVRNFRNLKNVEYEPSPGINIFIGDNAQGKTNLLESIFMLSAGTSFRKATDANLVNYEAAGYVIQAKYCVDERVFENRLEYNFDGLKHLFINNKKTALNHKDRLRVVLFTPDDLFLVKGSPGKRRAFLDFILKQVSVEYAYNLDNYTNILRKRNWFLKKEQTNGNSFKIVNELFIEKAIRLIIQRINFVNIIDDLSRQVFREINQGSNELKTRYALSFTIDSDKINLEVLEAALRLHIDQSRNDEIIRRKTLVGPHLEDINFYQDGRLARTFASQGQQRNIAISMKLAEMYAFKKIKDHFPVFLLDEVLSELDESKRKMLTKHLQEADFQTFLTSVSMDNITTDRGAKNLLKDGILYRKEL